MQPFSDSVIGVMSKRPLLDPRLERTEDEHSPIAPSFEVQTKRQKTER